MVTTQAKRKKTADMPDSPPKRVTRARAAKGADDVPVKPKTTRITTASSKAAAEKKKSVKPTKMEAPAKVPKRKTRAQDQDAEVIEASTVEKPVVEDQQEKPAKELESAEQQPKKAMASKEAQVPEAPKTRGRKPKPPPSSTTIKAEAPKPPGRSTRLGYRALTITKPKEEMHEKASEPSTEPVKKTTRGRPAGSTSKASSTMTRASKAVTAPTKKRVEFDDGQDKENVPAEKVGPKKSALKPTGLNARPLRKPVGVRAAARGKKAIVSGSDMPEKKNGEGTMPLSPKKINQVAKSDPTSEDELAGGKSPFRALSKSPSKPLASPAKKIESVSKPSFDQDTAPSSPTRPASSSISASPPRRPPPSPFKDALKASPKKFDLGDSLARPLLLSSDTPKKASLLQESPRRGVLADTTIKPILFPNSSPQKRSLLQSPARRPICSPNKLSTLGSPEKSKLELRATAVTSPHKAGHSAVSQPLPEHVATSPFRAAKSPERRIKVHIMTDEERDGDVVEDPKTILLPPSPEKQMEAAETVQPIEDLNTILNESVISDDPLSLEPSGSPIHKNDFANEVSPFKNPAAFLAPAFSIGSSALRRTSVESQSSEDELASPQKIYELSPLKREGIFTKDIGTPAAMNGQHERQSIVTDLPFTPLADQLSSWQTASSGKQARPRQTRGMFSFGGATVSPAIEEPTVAVANASPAKSSFFEDEMAVHYDQANQSLAEVAATDEDDLAMLKVSQDSLASDEYGDENAAPAEPESKSTEEADKTITCIPARVFTPAKMIHRPGEFYTVSKVPLRPSAEEGSLKVPRQRSRSFGGPLATVNQVRRAPDETVQAEQPATPMLTAVIPPQTPSSGMRLDTETPGRTARKGTMPNVLKGAVVHVDVHTTEGADASGIFVDLLTQMGARCVKQWHWNPRASINNSFDGNPSSREGSPDGIANKIGITHVVYKDGGKRTLEKVRSAKGVVHCVGVGWVLDCEREDKWLDEAEYAIDTSIVPRGGGRRRKSMEPCALANLNGNLVPASDNGTPPKPADISPTKEFLTFDTPASRRDTFVIEPAHVAAEEEAPSTPNHMSTDDDQIMEDESARGSPATPYYLSKGAKLVQQTCPPKQIGPMSLFPVTGNIEDQPDEAVRRRLVEARRKSLQWSSRIRSPLGRTVSYGK